MSLALNRCLVNIFRVYRDTSSKVFMLEYARFPIGNLAIKNLNYINKNTRIESCSFL